MLIFKDPCDELIIKVDVLVQRYMNKVTGESLVFYGGVLMPRIPFIPCQLITSLAERAEYEGMPENSLTEAISLGYFCKDWGIGVKAFIRVLKKAMSCFSRSFSALSTEKR